MKIIIAPDKLRGSLTSQEAANVISDAVRCVHPDAHIIVLPMADGGEGTLESISEHLKTREIFTEACDPLFRQVPCVYRVFQYTAYIEMAQVSGLWRLHETEHNPKYTTTLGTGQLVKHAADHGCKEIYLGVGGSATNDGGMGFANALGYRFLNKYGVELKPVGDSLALVDHIEPPKDNMLENVRFWIASDVNNPLTGSLGATIVYGPQKGATIEIASELEVGMIHFAKIAQRFSSSDFSILPGAGAAGGLGFGAMIFGGGTLLSGIEFILQITGIDQHLGTSNLVITAEGKVDSQSFNGKVLDGLLKRCTSYQVPLWSFSGCVEYKAAHPFLSLFAFGERAKNTADSIHNAASYLHATVVQALISNNN